MDKRKIERINELARKKKSGGLTEAEAAEQAELRREYLAEFRENMKAMLDMADLPQSRELYRTLLRQHGNLAGTVQMARGRGCPATDQLAEEVEKTIRLLRICSREIQRLTE